MHANDGAEVLGSVQRLIVDEIDEDGSGMLQSSFSDSDTIITDWRGG